MYLEGRQFVFTVAQLFFPVMNIPENNHGICKGKYYVI